MSRTGNNIYERKDGRFEGRYIREYDENGKAKYASVYGHSYNEVEEKLEAMRNNTNGVIYSDMTFDEVAKEWKKERFDQLAASTRSIYTLTLNSHMLPVLRDERIRSLTVKRIDELLMEIVRRAEEAGKPIASSVQRSNRYLIRTIVNFAKEKDHPTDKPMEIRDDSKSFAALEEWEIEKICIEAKYDHSLEMLAIRLMLFIGIRSGEMSALNWDDINLEKREVHIS